MKKKFKDTAVGKILKGVIRGAIDVSPIPSVLQYFDRNQDGKVNLKDFKWFEFTGAVAMLAALIKLEIVDPEQVIELVKLLITAVAGIE